MNMSAGPVCFRETAIDILGIVVHVCVADCINKNNSMVHSNPRAAMGQVK